MLTTWLRALRLKFYPMSWINYSIGALLAGGVAVFAQNVFWLGLGFMFFLEVATVLTNELYDYETDRLNALAGPYSGGSRVLVNHELSFAKMRWAAGASLLITAGFALALLHSLGQPALSILLLVLVVMALGYTVPPLQLAYRSLGELDVAAINSFGVLLFGFVIFDGAWLQPLPWLLSVPLMLAFIPSITLSAVPDYEADKAAGKKTLAVRFGVGGAAMIAGGAAVLASGGAILLQLSGWLAGLFGPLIYLSAGHCAILLHMLYKELKGQVGARRIDRLLVVSLSFLFWFGVLPLVNLLRI